MDDKLRDAEAAAAEKVLGMFAPLLIELLAEQRSLSEAIESVAHHAGQDFQELTEYRLRRRDEIRQKLLIQLEDRSPSAAAFVDSFLSEFGKSESPPPLSD